MRRWKPTPGISRWIGMALLGVVVVATIVLGWNLAWQFARPPETWPVGLPTYAEGVGLVGLILLSGMLAYRVAAAFTLAYELDRNGLYIVWIGNRAVVPLSQIESIDTDASQASTSLGILQNIGYYWGQGRLPDGRRLHRFSTTSPARSLVLHTSGDSYAISPRDQDSFVQELEQRRRLGAVKSLAPTVEPGRMFLYAFWNDRVVRWSLVAAFGLNLLLLGFLASSYPDLAGLVEMRFNAAGQATELRPRHQVLFLPLAAFVLSLLNTGLGIWFYRRNQLGAQVLQLGSVLVQILFGVAILNIIAW